MGCPEIYYKRALQTLSYNLAYDEGTDPLNALIGGLTSFEYFIEIRDIEEDDED